MAQGEVFEVNTLIIRDPVSGLSIGGALWSEPLPAPSQSTDAGSASAAFGEWNALSPENTSESLLQRELAH